MSSSPKSLKEMVNEPLAALELDHIEMLTLLQSLEDSKVDTNMNSDIFDEATSIQAEREMLRQGLKGCDIGVFRLKVHQLIVRIKSTRSKALSVLNNDKK